MRIRVLAVWAFLVAGCGSDVDTELMADQVSRLNRDLALLTERVDALEKQLARDQPDPAELPADDAAPAEQPAARPAAPDTAPAP